MDGRARWEKNPFMPLPASTIDKLSDHAGAYVICVTCARCRHERELEPRLLAKLLGWKATLQRACARLRCSRCQSREVNVQVAFDERPRGWKSNPS
jgi:hypothetical protein